MIQYLSENPVLLLFTVASVGYLLGSIKINGNSLGVAAVLFTGLAFGAISPDLTIPEIIFQLGLAIFVYSIGLSSGPAFFNSFKKNGFRDFFFIFFMLVLSGIFAVGLYYLFSFTAATITGVYTGSTTNTAALAGVIDYMNNNFSSSQSKELIEQAVVGYSYSYPMGVLGSMIAIVIFEKLLKIDYSKEKESLQKLYPLSNRLSSASIEVDNEEIEGMQLRELRKEYDLNVGFGRIYKGGKATLSNWDSSLEKGDLVMIFGDKKEIEKTQKILGHISDTSLTYDRSKFDTARIFLSNPKLAGKTVASLNIPEKFNASITRIRRGDIDMLAQSDTVLELGDRIRFIAKREDLSGLADYFGDSYQASSKVNLFSFGLGIGLGLILGNFEFNLGPNFQFKLGYAGGPLIVGLILGALRRSGPIVWSLPYSANITLQQTGLILLLSAIGVKSGNAFIDSLSSEAFELFLASSIISIFTASSILFVGYRLFKMPFSILMGMVANQPAILDFATNRSKNRIPEFGYALMFPIALILKIAIAQVLFLILY